MTWTFTDDVGAFLDTAGAALAARPAENTLLLTATATLRDRGTSNGVYARLGHEAVGDRLLITAEPV